VGDAQGKGEAKKKERREVGEDDEAVIMKDSFDDQDEETLHQRFQLWSRFSRAGMPDVPVIIKKLASLEASLPVPLRKPHNVAQKHATKKLKIFETTSQEVSAMTSVVEYLQ
jgi:hypothetical protein